MSSFSVNVVPVSRTAKASNKAVATIYRRTIRRWVEQTFLYGLIVRTKNFESTEWLGVPIVQNVLDLWTIQETIAEVRPTLLIEVGTHKGGSSVFYGQLMSLMDRGSVLTIDIEDNREEFHDRVEFLHGSSLDPDIVATVRRRVEETDGPVMVILDGNHQRDHVAQELEIYAPMVTPGSLLLSQDGVIDALRLFRHSRPGPLPANRAFLDRHPEFVHDVERNERFGPTHHPVGWMKRVR